MIYNQPDSDIDERRVTLKVRCTNCKEIREVTICRESLADYTDNGDGTYTDLYEECAKCLGA